jgi:2-polyprenyl-3-methyl-5-hydroxy-6-metoxy-1,4-benzoquinol methylase
MAEIIKHADGEVRITNISSERRKISVYLTKDAAANPWRSWETAYPVELIRLITNAKGPQVLCDEIRRDEDPAYVQACLEKDIFGYLPPESFLNKALLDFGCGAGASTVILARKLKHTRILGVDLEEKWLAVARARAQFYGSSNVDFLCSPLHDQLPKDIGPFDYIVMSAVYEHLLPAERKRLLPQLWNRLKLDGVLFINQTPYRYFPFEGHTSRLPLLGYLPDRFALAYARRFSPRVGSRQSWSDLLRRGIRGADVGEILTILRQNGSHPPVLLEPNQAGLGDRIDLWYAGYAVSIANKYPWAKPVQRFMKLLLKSIKFTTGLVLVPSLSLAIQKAKS